MCHVISSRSFHEERGVEGFGDSWKAQEPGIWKEKTSADGSEIFQVFFAFLRE